MDENLNFNNLANISNPSQDKYSELVHHSALKKYSKLYFYLTCLNAIFILLYVIRWLFGLSYLNPTPNDLLENILSRNIPVLNTINCEYNNNTNPIFQSYPEKEAPVHISYTRIPVEPQINKLCGSYRIANFAKNDTFSNTCFESVFFREADCPVSQISGNSISELMYNPKLIVNSKSEKYFVYKQKIIPKNQNCQFIDEIDPKYNSFLLPFVLLIPIGLAAFLQCVLGGICLEAETKDDLSRPPLSSTSYTSYEKVGEIHTYRGDRLISTKDYKSNVTRVHKVYHQIPKTGRDYFFEILAVLAVDAVVIGFSFYNARVFYFFQKQVSLVIRMGNEKCFENAFYNEQFQVYGNGIDAKAIQMGIAVFFIGIANALCFVLTLVFVIWKIGIKRLFCFC